jgi:hypothetical protein
MLIKIYNVKKENNKNIAAFAVCKKQGKQTAGKVK